MFIKHSIFLAEMADSSHIMLVTKENSKKSVNVIFVNLLILSGLVVLACYLLGLRIGIFLPECIFWVSIGVTLILMLIECFGDLEIRPIIIVAQIIIFVFLLKSIYIPRNLVPFFGSDSYITYEAINYIQKEGWFSKPPWDEKTSPQFAHQKNYPFVPALSLGITTISGLDLVDWGRWGILSLSLISILMIYDIAYYLCTRKNAAFIAAIGFGFTYYYLMFHTQFLYEAIAFNLFLITIYSFIRSSTGEKNCGWHFIALASTEFLILTHHLTAFLLVVFLLLYNLIQLGIKKQQQWNLFLFALISLFTYWIYLRYTPFQIAQELIRDVFRESLLVPSMGISTPHTFRFFFTLLLQSASAIMFGYLALHNLLFSPMDNTRGWKIVSFLWGGGLGILTILGTVGIFGKLNSFPSRMEIYGYTFLIPLASQTLIPYKKFKFINLLLFIAILCHATSSLLRTAPYLYSEREPDLASGETRALWLNQEYNLITKINPNISGITGKTFRRLNAFSDIQSTNVDTDEGKTKVALNDYDYIALGMQDHFDLSTNIQNVFASSALNRVYDAGWAELYVKSFQTTDWRINSVLDDHQISNELTNLPLPNVKFTIDWWDWLKAFSIFILLSVLGYLFLSWLTKRKDVNEVRNDLGESGIGVFFGITLISMSYLLHDYLQKISVPMALMGALFGLFLVVSLFEMVRKLKTWGNRPRMKHEYTNICPGWALNRRHMRSGRGYMPVVRGFFWPGAARIRVFVNLFVDSFHLAGVSERRRFHDWMKQHIYPGILGLKVGFSGFVQKLKRLVPNIFLLLVIFSTLPIGAFFQASTNPLLAEPFIEFYVAGYTFSASSNSVKFTIGIKNHAVDSKSLILESTLDGTATENNRRFIVRPGETVVQTYSYSLPTIDQNNSKAEFLLKADEPMPIYTLSITTGS